MGDIINPKNIRCVGNGRCWSSSQRCGMPQGCCSSCCSRTCVGSSGSYCCCCSSSGQCYPPQCSCCKTKVRVRQACNVTTSCKVCSVQDINQQSVNSPHVLFFLGEKKKDTAQNLQVMIFHTHSRRKGNIPRQPRVCFNCSMLLPTRQVNSKHCQAHSVINTVNCLVHLVAQLTEEEGRFMQEVSSTPITKMFFQLNTMGRMSYLKPGVMQYASCKSITGMAEESGSYHQDHARPFQIALKYTYSWQKLVNSTKRLGNGACTRFTCMMQLIDHM